VPLAGIVINHHRTVRRRKMKMAIEMSLRTLLWSAKCRAVDPLRKLEIPEF
jgi:hypothetical protein